jgi:hypothetical protein
MCPFVCTVWIVLTLTMWGLCSMFAHAVIGPLFGHEVNPALLRHILTTDSILLYSVSVLTLPVTVHIVHNYTINAFAI